MNKVLTCRRCRQGQMQTIERVELFNPPAGEQVEVRELAVRCDHCGKETVLSSQMDENLRRRAARKEKYGEYLLGEDIFAFRRHWGLTQQAFSRVFGKGIIAFSRYETEKAYPDLSLTRLLKAAMRHPEVFKELADAAGVEVPFWQSHGEAEQLRKVRLLSVKAPTQAIVYRHASTVPEHSAFASELAGQLPQQKQYSEYEFHETDLEAA